MIANKPMTPHPAAEAAYWAVLSRNRIGDTATPERHREAIDAYMKERFGSDPSIASRELLRRAWHEINAINARSGPPEGIDESYWEELLSQLVGCLGDDAVPWMTRAATELLAPERARIAELEAEIAELREGLRLIEQLRDQRLMRDVARAALQPQGK